MSSRATTQPPRVRIRTYRTPTLPASAQLWVRHPNGQGDTTGTATPPARPENRRSARAPPGAQALQRVAAGTATKLELVAPDLEMVKPLLELMRGGASTSPRSSPRFPPARRGRCSPSRSRSTRVGRASRRCCPRTGPR
jgi:hypothetical protein